MTDVAPDPRTEREGICGATRTVGSTEWICIAHTHGDPPRPGRGHKSARPNHLGYHPRSERHFFVPRFPWRERQAS